MNNHLWSHNLQIQHNATHCHTHCHPPAIIIPHFQLHCLRIIMSSNQPTNHSNCRNPIPLSLNHLGHEHNMFVTLKSHPKLCAQLTLHFPLFPSPPSLLPFLALSRSLTPLNLTCYLVWSPFQTLTQMQIQHLTVISLALLCLHTRPPMPWWNRVHPLKYLSSPLATSSLQWCVSMRMPVTTFCS